MSGHYPVASGDPAADVLAAALVVFCLLVCAGSLWFLMGARHE